MQFSMPLAFILLSQLFLTSASAQQLYSISIPKTLIAIEDKLYIAIGFSEPGNAVDIKERTHLVHYKTAKAFAYSLDGDKPIVVLSKDKNTSDQWDLSKVTERSPGGPVIAMEGKFSGWYLDWAEAETKIMYKEKEIKVKQLILVKDPELPRNFTKHRVAK